MASATGVNAADHGLMPDRPSDQTTALQRAVDAAQQTALPLFIPKGVYRVGTVRITAPLAVQAAPGGAVLTAARTSPMLDIAPDGDGRIGPVHLHGLVIDGEHRPFSDGEEPALIRARDVEDLIVENVTLRNSSSSGLYLERCSARIRDNSIENVAESGIFTQDCAGLVIRDNRIRRCGNNGVRLFRSRIGEENALITGNIVEHISAGRGGTGPYGNAILVFRGNRVTVRDNKIAGCAFSAVRLNASSGSHIIANSCRDCRETAIWVEAPGPEPYEGGIVSANIVDGCGSGIAVVNINNGGRRVVISDNQITKAGPNTISGDGITYSTWGRGISAEADVLVSGNMIENASDWGIFLFPVNFGALSSMKLVAQAQNNVLKHCAGGIGFHKDDAEFGRLLIGGNSVYGYASNAKFGAIVPVSYDGSTGEVTRQSGASDIGNATESGFPNVMLFQNHVFN
ncbi:TIGR03808 family TAT-translocated repetitive protein [Terrihabitans sp. B22-R8]|uniref:TIGR03808 family TAT-translocated repetitive protein n=1 Tax=Terrihabitans sp. B22-R8 TaxID=3425128 RepID=UPI00403D2AD7